MVDTRKKESCKDSNCKCEYINDYSSKILLEMLHTTILLFNWVFHRIVAYNYFSK